MKPLIHANNSAKRFGGRAEDYQAIHDFMDMSKAAHADMRHHALLHHSLGPYVAERVFGISFTNSEGIVVSVRDVAELHIMEDLGQIPSFSDWVKEMPLQSWMGQPSSRKQTFSISELID